MLAGASALAAAHAAELAPIQSGLDYHSFANIEQFRVSRLELDLRVDLDAHVLRGAVGLTVKRLDPGATQLVLDTYDLNIAEVVVKAQGVLGATSKSETTWVSRPYHVEKKDKVLGQALVIELPPSKKSSEFVRIEYETSPTAPGLLWVAAAHTAGRHQPFLATLSRPIGARSWIPLQDTPQVRMTYAAIIHTSADVLAVMSAKNAAASARSPKRTGEYSFAMADAVPSSLMALAVGDFKFQQTGPRTGVYADKPELSAAAREFADADALLRAGEALVGPYRWERHDVVVMPPGFPDASMAFPYLAFLSPTVLAGDQSGAGELARTLAQSWSGGQMSAATWRDQWVTLGLADYLAGRMLQAVYGERRASLRAAADLARLRAALAGLRPRDTELAVDMRGRDPADLSGGVSGLKGGMFFSFLDAKFGHDRLQAFVQTLIEHFSSRSITTEQFLEYLKMNLLDRFPGVVTQAQVMAWMGSGIPDTVLPDSDAFASVDAARAAWLSGGVAAKKLDVRTWLGPQWVYFLNGMPAIVTAGQLAGLDQAFGFAHSADAAVAQSWFRLTIRHSYQPSAAALEQYLQTIGRTELIAPLYEALMQTQGGATQAKRVYALARPSYPALTARAIDAIVDPGNEAESVDE